MEGQESLTTMRAMAVRLHMGGATLPQTMVHMEMQEFMTLNLVPMIPKTMATIRAMGAKEICERLPTTILTVCWTSLVVAFNE